MIVAVEGAALERGLVGVVGNRVPGAKDKLVEAGQRNELANQRCSLVRAFTEADGGHLTEGTYGLTGALPDVLDAGDEGRGYRAQAYQQDAELAAGRFDFWRVDGHEVLGIQADALLMGELQQAGMPLGRNPAGLDPVLHGALAFAQQAGQ